MNRSLIAFAVAVTLGTAAVGTQAAPPYDGHRIYEPGRILHGPPAGYGNANDRHRDCRAERWNPDRRYFPGQTVWRKGEVYVARGVSRSVYNVNSPPEWTPNYWSRARC